MTNDELDAEIARLKQKLASLDRQTALFRRTQMGGVIVVIAICVVWLVLVALAWR